MIRLIGTRWKYSNVWSRGVLIGRNSRRECCTSTKQFATWWFVKISESLKTMRLNREKCRSGRTGPSRKRLYWKQYRGFESLLLPQSILDWDDSHSSQSHRFQTKSSYVIPEEIKISQGQEFEYSEVLLNVLKCIGVQSRVQENESR